MTLRSRVSQLRAALAFGCPSHPPPLPLSDRDLPCTPPPRPHVQPPPAALPGPVACSSCRAARSPGMSPCLASLTGQPLISVHAVASAPHLLPCFLDKRELFGGGVIQREEERVRPSVPRRLLLSGPRFAPSWVRFVDAQPSDAVEAVFCARV